MRIAVTGGTGLVGRFIVEAALARGHHVTVLSRRAPPAGFFSTDLRYQAFHLGDRVSLPSDTEALVHAAFSHLPGRYRGGEGDDPDGFLRANLDGSTRLFEAAVQAGVGRLIFLSSRAVYGDYPPGTTLVESMEARPDTLYGRVKREAERALEGIAGAASVRATGVYGPAGPGQRHKWADLFDAFLQGDTVPPRVATEVHGQDLAGAVLRLLGPEVGGLTGDAFNVSDMLLDRHDLLREVAVVAGRGGPLPQRADPSAVNMMDCSRLRARGWLPGGMERLRASLPKMLDNRVTQPGTRGTP